MWPTGCTRTYRSVDFAQAAMRLRSTGRLSIGPFVYVRFHGVPRYAGRYATRALNDWADWLSAEMGRGRPVFAYFNNTIKAQAAKDAVRLRTALAARSTLR